MVALGVKTNVPRVTIISDRPVYSGAVARPRTNTHIIPPEMRAMGWYTKTTSELECFKSPPFLGSWPVYSGAVARPPTRSPQTPRWELHEGERTGDECVRTQTFRKSRKRRQAGKKRRCGTAASWGAPGDHDSHGHTKVESGQSMAGFRRV